MEEAWVTIRLKLGYNTSPERDKSYPTLFVCTNKRKKNNIKERKKKSMRFTSNIVHMPLCMYICLCNFISSLIDIQ